MITSPTRNLLGVVYRLMMPCYISEADVFPVIGRGKDRSAFVKFKISTYSTIIIVGSRSLIHVLINKNHSFLYDTGN